MGEIISDVRGNVAEITHQKEEHLALSDGTIRTFVVTKIRKLPNANGNMKDIETDVLTKEPKEEKTKLPCEGCPYNKAEHCCYKGYRLVKNAKLENCYLSLDIQKGTQNR